jgi:hypothetical protein
VDHGHQFRAIRAVCTSFRVFRQKDPFQPILTSARPPIGPILPANLSNSELVFALFRKGQKRGKNSPFWPGCTSGGPWWPRMPFSNGTQFGPFCKGGTLTSITKCGHSCNIRPCWCRVCRTNTPSTSFRPQKRSLGLTRCKKKIAARQDVQVPNLNLESDAPKFLTGVRHECHERGHRHPRTSSKESARYEGRPYYWYRCGYRREPRITLFEHCFGHAQPL